MEGQGCGPDETVGEDDVGEVDVLGECVGVQGWDVIFLCDEVGVDVEVWEGECGVAKKGCGVEGVGSVG